MKSTIPVLLALALSVASVPAAATLVMFRGSIATAGGPGSMAATNVTTSFNTVSGFGLNPMAGGNPQVMSVSNIGTANTSGLTFTHATASPNTAGYSVLMDVYYTAIPNYVSLLQLNLVDDGDLFGRASGAIGINSDYAGTGFTANGWHRIVATVDITKTTAFLNLYIDGVFANSVDAFATSVDRFDLSDPTFLLFADEDGETANVFISQFAFADRIYSPGEVGALGGANAAPVPEPSSLGLTALAALGFLRRRR